MCTQISVGDLEVLVFVGFFSYFYHYLETLEETDSTGTGCLKTGGKCFPGYRGSNLEWCCLTQNVIKNILVAKDLILNKVFNVCVCITPHSLPRGRQS